MAQIVHYYGFILAAVALALTPGADTIYLLTRTISQGRSAGMASLLGITLGLFVHVALVSLGLAQLIAHSPLLFHALQYGGAAYLVYLGVKMWLSPALDFSGSLNAENQWQKLCLQGLITNLFNPKILLFFLTLLPQFVRVSEQTNAIPFLILGLTFIAIGTIWAMVLIFAATPLGNYLRRKPAASQIMNKLSGVVFVGLATKLVVQSK